MVESAMLSHGEMIGCNTGTGLLMRRDGLLQGQGTGWLIKRDGLIVFRKTASSPLDKDALQDERLERGGENRHSCL